ncbi:hypothetical protein TIFTF001_030998 [Ficus carica]|uniref:Uncharacterized protein n=1 Tax=Ficus carica TaxID=3494 RepID=A0AA88J4K2_FICCA|nr:hypothetical protein TIFTF001_030998 [Ficus carica]
MSTASSFNRRSDRDATVVHSSPLFSHGRDLNYPASDHHRSADHRISPSISQ